MKSQRIIIIFASYHYRNTEKIAQVIAQRLQAELVKPEQVDISKLYEFDIVGIGGGIYFGKPHEKIRSFLAQLHPLKGKKAFLFTTSGVQNKKYIQYISNKMELKGMKLIACFSCRGFATYGLLKLVGGLNKGHPDLKDLYNAEIFANNLLNRL
jgi:flavodoxin